MILGSRRARLEAAIAALLALAMILLRLPYTVRPDIFFNSDFAIVGLMARHILEGEWWTFYWGQATHGTFASAVTAAVLALTGWPALDALQVPPLLFQAAHVAVAYGFVRDLLGRGPALAYAALTLVPTRYFLFFTVRTSPNYSEVLTLGLAALWVMLRIVRREGRAGGLFFLWGFLTGFGMWLLMYTVEFVVAALLFCALAWRARHPGAGWHRLLAWSEVRACWDRGVAWAVVGWYVGYAPVTLHLAAGGVVENQFVLATPGQMLENLLTALRGQVNHFVYPSPGWTPTATALGVAMYGVAVLSLVRAGVAWWRESRRTGVVAAPLALWLLLPVSWGMLVISGYTPKGAERYLWPYQVVLPLAVVVLARDLGRWAGRHGACNRVSAAVVGLFLFHNAAVAAGDFLEPPWRARHAALALLEREGVRAGFAEYWTSYYLTLLADERIVIAPSDFDRYPPYTLFALSEPRLALILTGAVAGPEREFTIRGARFRQRGPDRPVDGLVVKFLEPS